MRVLHDRILIRRIEEAEVPEGSRIIRPEIAKDKASRGTVVSVGSGRIVQGSHDLMPLVVKPGDVVRFGKYAGVEMALTDETLLCLREDEILAIDD